VASSRRSDYLHPRTIPAVSVTHEGVDRRGAAQTALVSVGAAIVLIAIKLVAGLVSGSLALISEALHSGTDLIAALLAFLALRVAGRPPDSEHPYGHGKAEHLSALLEGAILVGASLVIVVEAATRLVGDSAPITTSWWIYAVLGLVIGIDALRTVASHRGARKHNSAALAAGAVHFAGDMAGTFAVIIATRWPRSPWRCSY
jgi:cation diffusion facilitator family transporter